MEADQTGTEGSVAVAETTDDAAQPAAQPSAGESGRQGPDRATVSAGMNAFMRGAFGQEPAATSKPAETASPGEPTAQADVEAGSEPPPRGPDGKFLPRRGVPEVAKQRDALREEVRAELLAEQARSAETAKLDELAQTRAADVQRYRKLQEMPDVDLSGDDYTWREDFKAKLALLPEVGALHQTMAEQRFAEQQQAFHADQRQQITQAASEFGADPEAWKQQGTTWVSMTRDCVEAVAAPLRSRITQLERDLHNARTNGLGAVRVPVAAGRSGSGVPQKTMNDWLRGS